MKKKLVKNHLSKNKENLFPINGIYSQSYLESFLNIIPDILIQIDEKGKVIYINRPFKGQTIEKIYGRNLDAFFPIQGKINIKNIISAVLNDGIIQQFEYNNFSLCDSYLVKIEPVKEHETIIGATIILKDNTEFKLAEETKRTEDDFIKKLIESTRTIVLILDKQGKILKINPFLEEISGYSQSEVKGKDWFTVFLHDEEQNRIREVFEQSFTDIPSESIINTIITKAGQKKVIEWYSRTLNDTEDHIIGLLCMGYDITERLEAEEALRKSKTQLFNAMMIAKIGYWEYDFTNDLFAFNDQFYSVFQTTASEVGGYEMSSDQYIELFVYPDDRQKIKDFIFNAKAEDNISEGQILEHRIEFKDGSKGYISVRIIVIKDETGKLIKIFGANQDVTERVCYEEAIRTSEAQLSNAMKIAHLGYWEFDVVRNIFIFNDHFYSIFRTTADEVGGYTMCPEEYAERFLYPDDRNLVSEEVKKALEAKDSNFSRQLEHRILYADGEVGYISVSFYIVKDSLGKTIKTYGANQDITERKKIEQKLEEQNTKYAALNLKLEESLNIVNKMNVELELAKNKAEENDKLKSAFLANMSHEIRTPMNGIIGFAKMLNKKGLSDERREQYTDIINEMSHQLLHMIDEIIDISKIETGQLNIHKTKTNINDIFLRLFSYYKSSAEKSNINLYVQKGLTDGYSEILTDGTKFRQILDNLLINAIKFTHHGYVKFGYELLDDGFLQFYVEDTGIGIAPEMQVTVFESFRQVENGHTKMYGGTGLGLSISKAFIEKLGGKIWVTSTQGRGSTFYFTIPFVPTNINSVQFLSDNKKKDQSDFPTILVVEDEEINYLFLEEVLMEYNIIIIHAKRGIEAIEKFEKDLQIDLVLLDIKLPDISGFDVMKKMKMVRPQIPIIAQTAYALSGDMEDAIEAGFDDYIAKPIDEAELLNKISCYTNINKVQ